jgi:predicted nucleic acid-binding protein
VTDTVFLDSGIFIAFLNKSDRWHSQARDLFGGTKPRWSTSYLVVSETYSWFLHRYGEEDARAFRLLIDRLEGLRIFEATAPHHADVAKMLDRLRGTKLTYVDASSVCLLAAHRIQIVWSTDHHLAVTGARVLPFAG